MERAIGEGWGSCGNKDAWSCSRTALVGAIRTLAIGGRAWALFGRTGTAVMCLSHWRVGRRQTKGPSWKRYVAFYCPRQGR